jgi:hypothetical protein
MGTTKCDLDSTLRYVYSTFRNKNYTMAIEFKHNGRIWRCDTAEEAIGLRNQLEQDDEAEYASGGDPSIIEEVVWTADIFTELLNGSGTLQKKLLKFLYEKTDSSFGHVGVDSAEIVKALKIDSEEALAGVLSGLSKNLKRIGRQPSELYSVDVQWLKDGKVRKFRLKQGFRWAATQLGWPEKWI